MALTGPQSEQLTAALCDAFDKDGLEQMVRFKLGEFLDQHVDLGRPMDSVAYETIHWAEQVGLIEALIQAVWLSRARNKLVANFVETHFPQLKTPVAPEKIIQSVQSGFAATVQLLADPNVRLIVGRYRAYFETTRSRVELLGKYKGLHDRLHTLQRGLVEQVAEAADKGRPDGPSDYPLDQYAYQLGREAEQAEIEAEGLPNFAEEHQWIAILARAAGQLGQAWERRDPVPLRQALTALRYVLSEAPRINSLLTGMAAGLGLEKLIDAMDEIRGHLDQGGNGAGGDAALRQVRAGLGGLRGLQPRLAGLVQEHFAWQWLDKEITAAWSLPGASPEECFPFWDDVRTRVAQLCAVSPEKDWSVMLSRLVPEMEAAGAARDPLLLKQKFGTFRTVARDRFFDVDVELLRLSGQLARVGESLDLLLGLATDDRHN
jgi:Effector-associated domain 1